jgi:hypothetical protein
MMRLWGHVVSSWALTDSLSAWAHHRLHQTGGTSASLGMNVNATVNYVAGTGRTTNVAAPAEATIRARP